ALDPRGGGLALCGRWDTVALQGVAHGLVTDDVPEIGQGADDAIIAPGTILFRHAHHQILYGLVNRGASRSLALLEAVELLGHELTMPAKNRLRLDDGG